MSLVWSNILATVAVVGLPIVGWSWVAPKLNLTIRRYFFALTVWGIPFALGQYSQQDKWGDLWIQYHLLDLSYAPWGIALVMGAVVVFARLIRREVTDKLLLRISFVVILGFGFGSEVWDTWWAWSGTTPLASAIDVGDYATIGIGGVVAALFYLWFQRTPRGGGELGASGSVTLPFRMPGKL